jgi:hypothetical protein
MTEEPSRWTLAQAALRLILGSWFEPSVNGGGAGWSVRQVPSWESKLRATRSVLERPNKGVHLTELRRPLTQALGSQDKSGAMVMFTIVDGIKEGLRRIVCAT